LLPCAAYAEKDGTFTNFQGRVQRIHAAFPPLGESRPEWDWLSELASKLAIPTAYPDSQTVFAKLAKEEPAFAGMSYATLGDRGQLLRAASAKG
jgi:predicted molibdopterin-dependent oxidoreductase YjgC